MAKELRYIDISDRPDLVQLVEQARRANESLVLRQDSVDVAILRPVKRSRRKFALKGHPTTADDPIWQIVGMAHSTGPGDVADNVDRYLAEAHLSTAE